VEHKHVVMLKQQQIPRTTKKTRKTSTGVTTQARELMLTGVAMVWKQGGHKTFVGRKSPSGSGVQGQSPGSKGLVDAEALSINARGIFLISTAFSQICRL